MSLRRKQYLWSVAEWLLATAFVVAAALLSKLFTRNSAGVSSIWLANGIMLGFLLHTPRSRWLGLLTAFALGQVIGSMAVRDPPLGTLMAVLFNTLEVLAAGLPLASRIGGARDLSQPRNSFLFLAVLLLAPLLSALTLGVYLLATGALQAHIVGGWYVGHVLGMATAAPVMLALRANALARVFRREHRLEVVLSTSLIVLVTTAVFSQERYALLYLIFPPMVLAALRGGFAGTAFALILVTGIAAILTSLGHGPLMLTDLAADGFGVYVLLQVFVAALLLTCFPVAVGMAAWRRNQRNERRLRTVLGLLAEHSSDVIVLTDLDGNRVFVTPSVRDVLGWEPEEFLRGTFKDLVHQTHFDEVQRQLEQLRQTRGGKATITFPTRRKDGRYVWLEARVRHFRDAEFVARVDEADSAGGKRRATGDEEGFVVTLRNVTRRRQTEQALEYANRKLSSLALKDALTGLGNRRQFDRLLAEHWRQCGATGQPMAVVLLDVDYFKLYNDHYGHQQGDQCLREVARAIAGSVRGRQDCTARYGGEEFAVVLAGADAADARQAAERIRADVEHLAIAHAGSPFGHVTVTVGVASFIPSDGIAAEALVNAADVALYQGKSQGRNRVCVHASDVDGGANVESSGGSTADPPTGG